MTALHLGRYSDLARLLLKHGRSDLFQAGDDGGESGGDGAATVEDATALAADLEAMGPTFVKLGQLLSTRADLLPPVYLEALRRLQDHVEPIPFAEVERIVTAELGVRMSKAFEDFDVRPAASASLGQVHRAHLRDGRAVAVKVQRPDIEARIVEDMEVIDQVASFVDEHTKTGRHYGFAANRVTAGLVIAALVIGAALMMRINTPTKLFGYPALAIVLFMIAAGAAGSLLLTIVLSDLPQRRGRGRGGRGRGDR